MSKLKFILCLVIHKIGNRFDGEDTHYEINNLEFLQSIRSFEYPPS